MRFKNIMKNLSFFYLGISTLLFFISMFCNRDYFGRLSNSNIIVYQSKQVACVLFVFLLGYLFLKAVQTGISEKWLILFSFPVGLSLWALVSIIILLLEIPYRFLIVLTALFLLLCLFYAARLFIFRKKIILPSTKQLPAFCCVLGTALLVSTGYTYVILSYDSVYYFLNYGYSLTLLQNFQAFSSQDSYVITNIGQFLPVVSALPAFFGLDQNYQLQTFLSFNLVAAFYCSLSEYFKRLSQSVKHTRFYAILFTLLLVTSTCFIFSATWALANMYCMVFIFFSFLLGLDTKRLHRCSTECCFMLALFLAALTLLRKDGLILSAIVFVVIIAQNILPPKKHFAIFLPSAVMEIWWLYYVKKVLSAQTYTAHGTSLTSDSNVKMLLLIILAVCCYICIHPLIAKIPVRLEHTLILTGLFLITCAIVIKLPLKTFDNIDVMLKVIYRIRDSFGIAGIVFPLLFVLLFALWKVGLPSYTFVFCLSYALINFCAYDYMKEFTLNIDDSFTRVLMQIVPVVLYGIASFLGRFLLGDNRKEDSDYV